MDNQQETLQYIAGLFEGEGSCWITRFTSGQGHKIHRADISFTNTEPEIIQLYVDFLKKHNIKYHLRTDVRKNRKHKVCYEVKLTSHQSKLTFMEMLQPLMAGIKKKQMEFATELISCQQSRQRERSNTGRYLPVTYEDLDSIYDRWKAMQESSETKRRVPVQFG